MFLEVQVQNISTEPLLFSKLHFGPADGLEVQDLTIKSAFPVQPGDILQCLYIVKPKVGRAQDLVEKARLSKNAMGLGRLDIRWTGRMGDFGHLTTSQLVRRMPAAYIAAASAVRAALQPAPSTLATPDRAFRSLRRSPSPLASPSIGTGTAIPTPRQSMQIDEPLLLPFGVVIQASLYTIPPLSDSFEKGKPFELHFKLKLWSTNRSSGKKRHLRLAAQHVDHYSTAFQPPAAQGQVADAQVGASGSARQSLETNRPLPPTPRRSEDSVETRAPPPYVLPEGHPFDGRRPDQWHLRPSQAVRFYGNSLLAFPEVVIDQGLGTGAPSDDEQADVNPNPQISVDSTATDDVPLDQVARKGVAKRQQIYDGVFSLHYISFASGIHAVGGVRILLLEDRWTDDNFGAAQAGLPPCSLLEHSVIAEVVMS